MATFSQQFLANLSSPTGMLQGAANLGAAIGGVPGQMKEKRFQTDLAAIDTTTLAGQIEAQKKLLSRETDSRVILQLQNELRRLRNEQKGLEQFGQLSTATEQGTRASQEGNLIALDAEISKLRGMLDAPGLGIDQKRSIDGRINDLTARRVGAKEINVTNETRELFDLTNKINDPALSDSEKVKHQARIDTIRQNPTVVGNYQKLEMSRRAFEEKTEDIKAEQWLDKNMSTINNFITDGNDKGLEDFIQGAGEYTDDAQAFATKALSYKESIIKFKVQNENTKRKPNLDLYQEEIDLLPEELKENLGPALNAYKEIAKKWNSTTETWEGGVASRTAAIRLEKLLQERIVSAQRTASTAAFNDNRNEKNLIKKLTLEAKLNLDGASTLTYQDRTAARLNVNTRYTGVKDDDKPTPAEKAKLIEEEEQSILRDNKRAAAERLDYLQNIGEEKPVDDGDKPPKTTQANIEASEKWNSKDYEDFTTEENALINRAIDKYKDKNLSKTQIIKVLIRGGKLSFPKERQPFEDSGPSMFSALENLIPDLDSGNVNPRGGRR